MKKTYISPEVKAMEFEVKGCVLQDVSSNGLDGMGNGTTTSNDNVTDADANEDFGWEW